jgi:hypothetical protein
LVSTRSDVRIRHDGFVAGRHKVAITEDDANDAVRHAVASAKLEGVSLRKRFVERLYQEALAQRAPSGKQRRASKQQTHI